MVAKVDEVKATPAPSVAPVAATGGCETFRAIVSEFDWDVPTMMAIMEAESGCTPHAVGDNYPIAGVLAPSCGLFQIRTLAGRPSCEQLKDPHTNIEWAYKIYSGQGLQAWSVFTNGKYLRFM